MPRLGQNPGTTPRAGDPATAPGRAAPRHPVGQLLPTDPRRQARDHGILGDV